jgi:phosphoglycolate phosphatase-like HAD superfamily hydrolase
VRDAVDAFAARFGFRFPAVYTREDGPPKPAADGARHLCAAMGVAPADTLAVGDYKYDIMSGRAAGCATALVTLRPPPDLTDWGSPDLVVPSLRSLLPLW